MAESPDPSAARTAETDITYEKRRYHRVTTRLHFRLLPLEGSGRPWLYLNPGEVAYFYRPGSDELREGLRLLASVGRRTINFSEGGARIRLPEEEPDLELVQKARWSHGPGVHFLVAFREGHVDAVFHLPAKVVRIEHLPWAQFVALAFHRIPLGLQRHLEAFVLATDRQRRRRNLVAYGRPEEADMAERLQRLETEERHTHPHHYRSAMRRKPGDRYFP